MRLVFIIIISSSILMFCDAQTDDNILVFTVASNYTDGYNRFLRSSHIYDIPVQTLGLATKWEGGSMKSLGGGQKINLLKEALEPYKDDSHKIILFTDGYDVIYLSPLKNIVNKFIKTGARILFGVEYNCWPNEKLWDKYPPTSKGPRYLNSGGFIGYANDIYSLLSHKNIANDEDDQLYYTEAFLDEKLRASLNIQLDYKSDIFQNLASVKDDLELKWENHEAVLVNLNSDSRPDILHGSGISKLLLNHYGNYLAQSWLSVEGCQTCNEDTLSLSDIKDEDYPTVLISVFIPRPMPFLEEFFATLKALKYPIEKLHLFIYNNVPEHEESIDKFVNTFKYQSVKRIKSSDNILEAQARDLSLNSLIKKNLDYYFNIDGEARLDNPYALRLLIEQNRTIVAPLLVRPYKAWSNFWGALTDDGYYARSSDYMDIVNNVKRGLWNVPYINSCYLINGSLIKHPELRPKYTYDGLDPDMAFCRNNRFKGIFMYIANRVDFGHLVNSDEYDVANKHPDVYNIFNNQLEWEKRYIHENYSQNLDMTLAPKQPCPDVFWFPVVSPRFCLELIDIMENFGKWSDGTNKDDRLTGGYEAVPTRDIHMNQVGLEKQWLHFLKLYVLPLNQRVYAGYQDAPPRSLMNFVVRYRPDEQPSLRPHHDTSTYTINVALNTPYLDYEGGGCRFIRYNCSVTDTKMGWLLMHPGRLTHYHEGLLVTKGTSPDVYFLRLLIIVNFEEEFEVPQEVYGESNGGNKEELCACFNRRLTVET